jgi:histidyl-tRNA synthetase
MSYSIPRGTYDILPKDSYRWQALKAKFTELAKAFGYEEITTPIFEVSDLFERSSGESSDVVQKEMYRFTDKKGRSFALRPEGTAPVVRAYVEHNMAANGNNKLWYWGPMFRYDRPQAGRYRQFYQYGLEFIGSDNPYWDAELISFLWLFLSGLGLKHLRLELNSVGCPNCSQDYDNALRAYFQPHLESLCPDCQKRYETKPRRLLDCKVTTCKQIAGSAPSQLDYLDEPCRDHFAAAKSYLDKLSIPYTINPKIVRGLDYYTNTAFEIVYEGIGAQNSLAGGGRYNGLIEQIGGKPTPAIGFAGGIERLLIALENEGISLGESPGTDLYLIPMGEQARDFILPWINRWRLEGITIGFDPDKSSFKSQLKAANNSQARFAAIIGEDELAQESLMLKDMQSGEQSLVKLTELEFTLKTKLSH